MTTGPTDGTVTTAAGGPDGMPLALKLNEGLGPNAPYVPVMERGPQDTAYTEMLRLLDLSIQQAAEISWLRATLLNTARRVEALKRPCGMDPESAQALRNGQYMSIADNARRALGPNDKLNRRRRHEE